MLDPVDEGELSQAAAFGEPPAEAGDCRKIIDGPMKGSVDGQQVAPGATFGADVASRINQAIDLAKERAQPEKDRIIPGSNAGHLGERDIGDFLVVISCKPRLCALENAFSWEEKAPVKRLSNGERYRSRPVIVCSGAAFLWTALKDGLNRSRA